MSKITRTGDNENYNLTSNWLKDFAKKYAKEAKAPPPPPVTIASTEKFATIEEKMKDIMSRVGFSNITNIKEGSEEYNKKMAKSQCSCTKKCICDEKEKVRDIMEYISRLVESEPDLPTLAVMDRCKSEDGLGFTNLTLDHEAMKNYIDYQKSKRPKKSNKVTYQKREVQTSTGEDDVADYWNHGIPSKK